MKRFFLFSVIGATLLFSACSVQKPTTNAYQNIADLIENSPINQQHHVGFVIKELGSTKNMYEKNATLYFTPASNTKLFTFYTALNLLGDSIPSFEYVAKKDSLIIWPMADASFLHPNFKSQKAFDFMKNSGKDIYLVNGRYLGERFGYGWNWDDYNEDYQAEINDFPIYGNMMKASGTKFGKVKCSPDLSAMYLNEVVSSASIKKVKRNFENNNLTIPSQVSSSFKQNIPFHLNKSLTENLITDTLLATGSVIKPVVSLAWKKVPTNAKTLYSIPADSLYKLMLQMSDNFIAEELLLNCAAANHLTMRTDSVISVATKNLLNDMPQKIQWVDGSGLSRLNLFTPQDITVLLQKIYDKVGNEKRLFSLLPAGGQSGTLKIMFKSATEPFVFAKSGGLTNNYNLSGYLVGKSGKKYIFSFMNNSFLNSSAEIRQEVDRILTFVHDNY